MTMPDQTHQRAEWLAYHMMGGNRFEGIHEAREFMLEQWTKHNADIPVWMDLESVGLDLTNSDPDTVKQCVDDIIERAKGCRYIEPSARAGPFLEWLPPDTIALDALPRHHTIQRGEFLTWETPEGGPYCVVGAPPFGDRLWLTNAFTVRALDIAELVGFITDTRAVRDMPNGTLHHTIPLRRDTMRGLSRGRVRRHLEWRVWCSTAGIGAA